MSLRVISYLAAGALALWPAFSAEHPFDQAVRRAEHLLEAGQPVQAESLLRAAIDQSHDAGDARLARAFNSLASTELVLGRLGDAERLYQKSASLYQRAYGLDHPGIILANTGLATVYAASHQFARAETLLRHNLAALDSAHAPPGVRFHVFNELARTLTAEKKFDQAIPLFEQAAQVARTLPAENRFQVAYVWAYLGDLYRLANQPEEASRQYERALARLSETFGSDGSLVVFIAVRLAGAYADLHRYADAEPLLERTLASEAVFGPNHPAIGNALAVYARVLRKTHRAAEARRAERRAHEILDNSEGATRARLMVDASGLR